MQIILPFCLPLQLHKTTIIRAKTPSSYDNSTAIITPTWRVEATAWLLCLVDNISQCHPVGR